MILKGTETVGEKRCPLSFLGGHLLGQLDQPQPGIDGGTGRTSKGGRDDEEGFGTR